jgi:transcriptional regulator with XRE-family HTH domain
MQGAGMSRDTRAAQIGARLRESRVAARLTQEEAGQGVGVSRTTIANWESGRNLPDLVQFADLMALYGESAHKILFGRYRVKFDDKHIAELRRIASQLSPEFQRKLIGLLAMAGVAGGLGSTERPA